LLFSTTLTNALRVIRIRINLKKCVKFENKIFSSWNCQKHFFKHSNLRKVNCVAYFVLLRRELIKWAHCIAYLNGMDYTKAVSILTGQNTGCVAKFFSGPFQSILSFKNIGTSIERRFIQKSF
jgi:hypothetical protein